MAGKMRQKYNLKDELKKKDEELRNSCALVGASGLTNYKHINSMRTVMFTAHTKQFVNLLEPDFPGVFTNMENVVGKYSLSAYKKAKKNYVVYKKVEKYKRFLEKPYKYHLFVYSKKKHEFDVIERKPCEDLTEIFGYRYNNEQIDSLEEGDDIKKDDVLYKSTSFDDTMNYQYGKDLTVMMTLDSYTSEDAAVISESAAKELTSLEVSTIEIGINDNDYLKNIHGKKKDYRIIPDIGTYCDGVLGAKTTLFKDQILYDFKDSNLIKIDYSSDIVTYAKGKIVDIEIFCNNEEIEANEFNQQILEYLEAQTEYYTELYNTCKEIIESGHPYTHNIEYLFKRSRDMITYDAKWKEKDTSFNNIKIFIQIEQEVPATDGQKITGRYGNKCVISKVLPDDEMPYTEDGRRVQLLIHSLAIVNRTIAMALFEVTINFMSRRVQEQMTKLKTRSEQEKLLFDFIGYLNEEQSTEMKKTYMSLSEIEKDYYIKDAINDKIYIHTDPVEEGEPLFFKIMKLYEVYDFFKPYDIYINKWGRKIKTLNQQYIGNMYIIKLKQTSNKGHSAVSTSSINSKGLPEKSYKSKIHQDQVSKTPIRFGEFETLNFSIGMEPNDISQFHLMYRTSVLGRRDFTRYILQLNPEFKLKKFYTNRVAEIFEVYLKSLGLELNFVDEDNMIKELDTSVLKEYRYNGQSYIMTPWEMYQTQLKDGIKKSLLLRHGVMDETELEHQATEMLNKIINHLERY